MNLIQIINRPAALAVFAACAFTFVSSLTGVRAHAMSSGQSGTGGKTTCTDSTGKTVSGKDCEKAGAKGKPPSGTKAAPSGGKSGNKESAASSPEKDKLSSEHMSTRGLKPPPKNADHDKQQKKADDAPKQ